MILENLVFSARLIVQRRFSYLDKRSQESGVSSQKEKLLNSYIKNLLTPDF
jgi:hypothetical protein